MCGIAGILQAPDHLSRDELAGSLEEMAGCLAHRGPDDVGTWLDGEDDRIGFGFRRLAILDLSPAGHQPMVSASGRFVIVFNGEVYNFGSLREELRGRGHGFRGGSDTEVLLAAFEEWGVERAIPRFQGMFAFGVWDREERLLHLARDRLGIKPLYIWRGPRAVGFASELKAITTIPGFSPRIDRTAVGAFLRYLYVPGPRSIYEDVWKLPAGHRLALSGPGDDVTTSTPYWSLSEVARRGLSEPFDGGAEEAVAECRRLLTESVRQRLQADVPLGAFLSGGIDSSLIVALMQAQREDPVRTFSIGFARDAYDETSFAAAVAEHLGTDHEEFRLEPGAVQDSLPELVEALDEPFASASAIPNYLLCQAARRHVTVALTGTGGDEVFAGYNRYAYGEKLIGTLAAVPAAFKKVFRRATRLSAGALRSLNGLPGGAERFSPRTPGKIEKMSLLAGEESTAAMYRTLVSAWHEEQPVEGAGPHLPDVIDRVFDMGELPEGDLLSRMLLADQLTYLTEDQLTKVDRVSMAVGLELRVPLLDHRLVEFAWSLPRDMKISGGETKWILREVLREFVPQEFWDRPKVGLSIPLAEWLRGPLRGWAEDLLAPDRLEGGDLLRSGPIRGLWAEFLAGETELEHPLWAVLVLQAWRRRWID